MESSRQQIQKESYEVELIRERCKDIAETEFGYIPASQKTKATYSLKSGQRIQHRDVQQKGQKRMTGVDVEILQQWLLRQHQQVLFLVSVTLLLEAVKAIVRHCPRECRRNPQSWQKRYK